MSKVSIYLNFQGNTEEAFNFYKSVFNTEFVGPIMYNKDIPAHEGMDLGHAFGLASLVTDSMPSKSPVSSAFTAPGTCPVET